VAFFGTKIKCRKIVFGWQGVFGGAYTKFWSLVSSWGWTTVTGISKSTPFSTFALSYALTLALWTPHARPVGSTLTTMERDW
jgi:hypothetical protein